MKILFVASRTNEASSLQVSQEINVLQDRLSHVSEEAARFVFLPDMKIGQLPFELSKHAPDVLHISAHGRERELIFADDEGNETALSAGHLSGFFGAVRPEVVYLNGCNSAEMAKEISKTVNAAIGTTSLIVHVAARGAAALFYERLLQGHSIKTAFEASRSLIEALQDRATTSKLFCRKSVDASSTFLHQRPSLVASFSGDDTEPDANQHYTFDLGIFGCPEETSQIVFFTDDESFIAGVHQKDWEYYLSTISRGPAEKGQRWEEAAWYCYGDCRIFACGITSSGKMFSVQSFLCTALERFYMYRYNTSSTETLPKDIRGAIQRLSEKGGARLRKRRGPAKL